MELRFLSHNELMWDIWDKHQMWATINRDLALIEKCIAKKKEYETKA